MDETALYRVAHSATPSDLQALFTEVRYSIDELGTTVESVSRRQTWARSMQEAGFEKVRERFYNLEQQFGKQFKKQGASIAQQRASIVQLQENEQAGMLLSTDTNTHVHETKDNLHRVEEKLDELLEGSRVGVRSETNFLDDVTVQGHEEAAVAILRATSADPLGRARLNFYRISRIILDVAVKPLRALFKREWDTAYPAYPWSSDPASGDRMMNGAGKTVEEDPLSGSFHIKAKSGKTKSAYILTDLDFLSLPCALGRRPV